jgi:hypothetical protein
VHICENHETKPKGEKKKKKEDEENLPGTR